MATVILLPGLACDDAVWSDIAPQLAPAHRVVVSQVHFRHDTLPAMAAALLAEQAQRGAGPLVLVGHSMGGMVALEAAHQDARRRGEQQSQARRQGARVQAVAVLGSTARPDTPELIALRSQACELFAAGRMDEVLRANLPFAFHPANAGDDAQVGRYLAMLRRAGAAALIRQNRAVMARTDARPRLPGIGCPVLLACGEADLLTPPEHAREMAALLPRARLAIVPGCGHMLTLEQPARVGALLREWLDEVAGEVEGEVDGETVGQTVGQAEDERTPAARPL